MITLRNRPWLFVDDVLVETMKGLSLRLHSPHREGPVLELDQPWEGPTSAYFSILEADDRYLMYYRGNSTNSDGEAEVTCVAESFDGIWWDKRKTWLFDHAGHAANNIVWKNANQISHNMAPFVDTNPDAPPDARFKAIGGLKKLKMFALASADGINWRLMKDEPVLTEGDFDSLNLAFWDSEQGCYVAYVRQFDQGVRHIRRCMSDDFLNWQQPRVA